MKRSFIPVAFVFVTLVLGVSLISPASLPALECDPDSISIATWNIRILSDGSRDDGELRQIARILERYDVIAVQELRDPEVVARLLRILPDYDAIISDPVGRGVTERYAVFFRNTLPITILEEPFLFPDPADQFIREPWVVWMRAGEFDFILVTIHVIYGDRVADRRAEISLLDDLLHAVESSFPEESDILLLGDFNRDATDEAWEMGNRRALVNRERKTTITDTSSFDNIWLPPATMSEYAGGDGSPGVVEIYPFDEIDFGNDDRAASRAVSDHRPVATCFRADRDDD